MSATTGTGAGGVGGAGTTEPIVFKCEASLWDMLASGEKTFDMRRFDPKGNPRIERLTWGSTRKGMAVIADADRYQLAPRQASRDITLWEPDVASIEFENKVTGETLIRRYKGMAFETWAPGWCFLLLGEIVLDAPQKELKA